MEYIPDRAEQEINRLTAYVRDNDDFANLMRALGGAKWQVMEDVYRDLLNKRHLGDAGDAQLDVIGKHLITSRQGLDDETYTALLDTRFEFFQRSGEPEKLIELYKGLTGTVLPVEYDDTFKLQCNTLIAGFTDLPSLEAVNQEKVLADMTAAKQAGQTLRLLLVLDPAFRFSATADESEFDVDHGFGSGLFVEIIFLEEE